MALSYILKDRKAQSELERMFPGFIKSLSFDRQPEINSGILRVIAEAPMKSTKGKAWHFSIPIDDVEIIEAFKPSEWNSGDCVPPEGVSMCVELQDQYGHTYRRVGAYNHGTWSIFGENLPAHAKITRFRSWE